MSPASRTELSFDREYPGEPASLRTARRDAVGWLADRGIGADDRDRAALVVSELASNAVEASPGLPYRVRVRSVAADAIEIEVHNRSAASPLPEAGPMAEPTAPRGRGLAIVGSLSQQVTVQRSGDEIVVRSRLAVATG